MKVNAQSLEEVILMNLTPLERIKDIETKQNSGKSLSLEELMLVYNLGPGNIYFDDTAIRDAVSRIRKNIKEKRNQARDLNAIFNLIKQKFGNGDYSSEI